MLWSQIQLTSYDFTDLHITGEFDYRPGTGRFLRIFSCVVTYRKGAGRRLYMKTLLMRVTPPLLGRSIQGGGVKAVRSTPRTSTQYVTITLIKKWNKTSEMTSFLTSKPACLS